MLENRVELADRVCPHCGRYVYPDMVLVQAEGNHFRVHCGWCSEVIRREQERRWK
jgi:ribosomal protein S27AE